MLDLWEALGKYLGSAFIKQYGKPLGESFEYWLSELGEFSEQDLYAGFQSFKNSGSSYISPAVFIAHCRKAEDLGINLDDAHSLVCAGEWSRLNPAFRVVCAPHRFKLRQLNQAESRRQFADLYREVAQRVRSGEEFQAPALEHKTTPQPLTENDRRKGRAVLDELNKLFGRS